MTLTLVTLVQALKALSKVFCSLNQPSLEDLWEPYLVFISLHPLPCEVDVTMKMNFGIQHSSNRWYLDII